MAFRLVFRVHGSLWMDGWVAYHACILALRADIDVMRRHFVRSLDVNKGAEGMSTVQKAAVGDTKEAL